MSATLTPSPRSTQEHTRRRHSLAIVAASSLALCAFAWPFVIPALPQASQAAAPFVALALVPALVVLASLLMDGSLRSSRRVALLGVLAAVGSIVRIATVGIAGVETIFIVLILAGRAFGARFGFLLGLITIGVSSLIMGSIGPWTPFQMFAAAWVGAGAGLLPAKSLRGWREIVFGALMNLWFWPFAVGGGTSISYDPSAASGDNLARFGLYTLITSTLTWDTVRALTTVVGIGVIGRYVLAALRRSN
jgi:ECF transporter, substrate-specific component